MKKTDRLNTSTYFCLVNDVQILPLTNSSKSKIVEDQINIDPLSFLMSQERRMLHERKEMMLNKCSRRTSSTTVYPIDRFCLDSTNVMMMIILDDRRVLLKN